MDNVQVYEGTGVDPYLEIIQLFRITAREVSVVRLQDYRVLCMTGLDGNARSMVETLKGMLTKTVSLIVTESDARTQVRGYVLDNIFLRYVSIDSHGEGVISFIDKPTESST